MCDKLVAPLRLCYWGVAFAHGRLDAIMVFVCVRMRDVVGPPIFFMEELNLESLFFLDLLFCGMMVLN